MSFNGLPLFFWIVFILLCPFGALVFAQPYSKPLRGCGLRPHSSLYMYIIIIILIYAESFPADTLTPVGGCVPANVMRLTYLCHSQQDNLKREAGLVCRLYIYLPFHSGTNYGIYGKPAGATRSLLTDYSNRLWVLFLRATIQGIIFSLKWSIPFRPLSLCIVEASLGQSAWYLRFRHGVLKHDTI